MMANGEGGIMSPYGIYGHVHVLVSLWWHIISYHIIMRENNERWKFCELSLIFLFSINLFFLSLYLSVGKKTFIRGRATGNNERWKFCELWKNFRGYFIHYSLVLLLLFLLFYFYIFYYFIIFIIFVILLVLSTPNSQTSQHHHHKILVWEKVLTLLL